jgi:uncharacterized protein (TIGR04222 family)
MNPLNWSAGPFLLLYFALLVATLWLLSCWSRRIGPAGIQVSLEGLDPVQLAYVAHGAVRAVDTLLVGLFEAGTVFPNKGGAPLTRSPGATLPGWAKPYADESELGGMRRAHLQKRLRSRGGAVYRELAERGLLPCEDAIFSFRMSALAVLALTVSLGLAKIILGSHRGHPIGFLCFLVLVMVIGGLRIMFQAPYRSTAGSAALAQFKQAHARALRAPVADELLTAFAITGAAVLAGKNYQSYFISAGGSGGSGCSGGGGGCGGGGCGGCS